MKGNSNCSGTKFVGSVVSLLPKHNITLPILSLFELTALSSHGFRQKEAALAEVARVVTLHPTASGIPAHVGVLQCSAVQSFAVFRLCLIAAMLS